MDLTDLPEDLFQLVVSFLAPRDAVVCRRVSGRWREAFGGAEASRRLLRQHFPRAREMRRLPPAAATAAGPPDPADWPRLFAAVARRYHHLRSARPAETETVAAAPADEDDARQYAHVEPWDRWLRWNENVAVFQHRDPAWCLEDGLLVYRDPSASRAGGGYVAYDLETRRRVAVPFDAADKTVRRLRLACGVLVVEWCDREPYHQLNDREVVHRHFATAFDVRRVPLPAAAPPHPSSSSWSITFRSEWKIHFLGLPLNRHDRFFSAQ